MKQVMANAAAQMERQPLTMYHPATKKDCLDGLLPVDAACKMPEMYWNVRALKPAACLVSNHAKALPTPVAAPGHDLILGMPLSSEV